MSNPDPRTPWLFDRTAKLTARQKRARREVRKLERLLTDGLMTDAFQAQFVTATTALAAAESGAPRDVPVLVARALREAADAVEREFEGQVLENLRTLL